MIPSRQPRQGSIYALSHDAWIEIRKYASFNAGLDRPEQVALELLVTVIERANLFFRKPHIDEGRFLHADPRAHGVFENIDGGFLNKPTQCLNGILRRRLVPKHLLKTLLGLVEYIKENFR